MKILTFIPVYLLLCVTIGCGSLHKQGSLQKHKVVEQQALQALQQSSALYYSTGHDSSTTLLEVVLQPIGSFSFSADSGFKGEAVQLSIRKKQQQSSQQMAKGKLDHTNQVQVGQRKVTEQLAQHRQKKKQAQYVWLAIMALPILVVYAYWRYRKQ